MIGMTYADIQRFTFDPDFLGPDTNKWIRFVLDRDNRFVESLSHGVIVSHAMGLCEMEQVLEDAIGEAEKRADHDPYELVLGMHSLMDLERLHRLRRLYPQCTHVRPIRCQQDAYWKRTNWVFPEDETGMPLPTFQGHAVQVPKVGMETIGSVQVKPDPALQTKHAYPCGFLGAHTDGLIMRVLDRDNIPYELVRDGKAWCRADQDRFLEVLEDAACERERRKRGREAWPVYSERTLADVEKFGRLTRLNGTCDFQKLTISAR